MEVGANFSICLGASERSKLRAVITHDAKPVWDAFAQIDVERCEAGNPRDQKMILACARRSKGGLARINQIAADALREWTTSQL
eukprot:COSAG02_NODE_31691_length_529_cov_0.681395_1_plen_83_part_10